MSSVPYSDAFFAESAAKFADNITPAKMRWEYSFQACTFIKPDSVVGPYRAINMRTVPVAARLLGVSNSRIKLNFFRLGTMGYDDAVEASRKRLSIVRDWFAVGPMQAWLVGHIYFARLIDHPHVVKIGFSRRVRERLDDIESRVKAKIELRKGELRVGTLADEHWWHKNWEKFNISGEWFFDPHMSDRSLPAFLTKQDAEAA